MDSKWLPLATASILGQAPGSGMRNVSEITVSTTIWGPYHQMRHMLFFCPEKVAIVGVSGIITTDLGNVATHPGLQGARRRIHHSKICPFP